MAFLADNDKKALVERVREIEAGSSAELVVAVRPRSDSHLPASMALAGLVALGVLTLLVYGPWPVDWHFLLIDPVLAGLLAGIATQRLPIVVPYLRRRATLRAIVERAAKAEFLDRGIHNTRDRTGILLYVSLTERSLAMVADSGVVLAVPSEQWAQACVDLRTIVEKGGRAAALQEGLGELGSLLATHLPSRADDINELPDAVEAP